ncbi:MAG: C-GCAxxG-C-C family protein [Proteobacteria bacterium]|nr:C-GCAxxG-C-C family protein [Pseudomonadota bacterium]MBU1738005.1 C-GCAxxG-C-C family protein [Pseudomonadota bacterium]
MFGFKKKQSANESTGEVLSSEEIARLAGLRAENLFSAHGLSCSEANLLVLNHGFGGKLSTETVINLGSGFGGGVGDMGSTCGALSGVVLGIGLYLGPGCDGGLGRKKFRALIGKFLTDFKETAGTVHCRELIADFRKNRKERSSFCGNLTGKCAEQAVRLLLLHRPELAAAADLEFLQGRDSRLKALVGRILPGLVD